MAKRDALVYWAYLHFCISLRAYSAFSAFFRFAFVASIILSQSFFFLQYESRSSSCVRSNSAEDSSCLPLSCSYSQSGSFFPFFREIELSLSSRSYFLSFEADRVGRIQADFFFCRLKGVVLRVQLMWWRALRSPLVSATQLLPSSGVFFACAEAMLGRLG